MPEWNVYLLPYCISVVFKRIFEATRCLDGTRVGTSSEAPEGSFLTPDPGRAGIDSAKAS